MLIIATAASADQHVTHHVFRDEPSSAAYRRLRPLLPVGTNIQTTSAKFWTKTQGDFPQDLRLLDRLNPDDRTAIRAVGGRLIPASTALPEPAPSRTPGGTGSCGGNKTRASPSTGCALLTQAVPLLALRRQQYRAHQSRRDAGPVFQSVHLVLHIFST